MYFFLNTTDEEFEQLAKEAIEMIPSEFKDKLENVSIVVEDWPSRAQLSRSGHAMLLGLYEGIPQTRRGRYGVGPTMPDRITIFRKPLERMATTREDLKRRITSTVWHEIAHHFGMDEGAVRHAEHKRATRLSQD